VALGRTTGFYRNSPRHLVFRNTFLRAGWQLPQEKCCTDNLQSTPSTCSKTRCCFREQVQHASGPFTWFVRAPLFQRWYLKAKLSPSIPSRPLVHDIRLWNAPKPPDGCYLSPCYFAFAPIESPRASTGWEVDLSCDGASASYWVSGLVSRDCGRLVQRLQPIPSPKDLVNMDSPHHLQNKLDRCLPCPKLNV
jgi:hypothetical protein